MSLNRKLFSISASDAAVCNSESLEPFGNEASFNKNVALYQFDNSLDDGVGSADGTGSGGFSYSTTHKFGSHSLALDGTDGKVSLGNQTWFNSGDYSVSMWIRNEGNDSAYQTLISKRDGADAGSPINLHMYGVSMTDGGKLYASFGGASYFKTTTVLSKNTWYHIVYTVVAGGAMKIYIDGVLDGTQATEASGTRATNSIDLAIGTNGSNTDYPFNGKIDQVRIYSGKTLSQEEVTTLYLDETDDTASTTTIIPGTSCIAYYPLDYDAQDKSTNYDGTPSNVEFVQNGKINYSAKFNGTTSKIQITSPIGLASGNENDNFSVSMWVKWDSVSSSASGLHGTLVGDYTGSNYGSFHIYVYGLGSGNGLALSFERYFNSTAYWNSSYLTVGTISTLEADTWYYITHTYVGSSKQVKLYSNTTLIATYTLDTASGGRTTNSYNVIGDYNNSSGNGHAGSIDEFRIFNKTLSSDEVTTLAGLTACTQTCTTDNDSFPTANQLGYYSFDSNIQDLSGTGNNATNSGITYGEGRFGAAGVFDAADYIDTNISLGTSSPTNTFTISFWAYRTVDAYHNILGTVNSSIYNGFNFGFYGSSGSYVVDFITRDGSGTVGRFKGGSFTLNQWHHFVVVNDSNNFTFYQNGSKLAATEGAVPEPGGSYTNTTDLIIGRGGAYTTEPFAGNIDQVRVFSTALTDTNIQDLYDKEFQCYITKDASNPFGSGEVAFFKFENNLTDTTGAFDSGSLQGDAGYSTTNPAFGTYSLSLDWTGDYVDVGATVQQPTANFSASAWVNLDTIPSASIGFVGNFKSGASPQVGWALTKQSGTGFQFWADGTASGGMAQGSTTPSTGRWYHLCGTYDGTTIKIYVNGVLDGSAAYSATPTSTDQNLMIGRWYGNYDDYYTDGLIDQVRIFSTALSGEQVWKLYAERNN